MIPTRPWPENQEPANCLDIINSLSSLLKEKDKTTIPIFEETKRSLGDCSVSFNGLLEIFAEDFGEEYANKRMFETELIEQVLEMAFRAGMEQAYRIDRAKVLDKLFSWNYALSKQEGCLDVITLLSLLKQATHSESVYELFRTIKDYNYIYEIVKASDLYYIERLFGGYLSIFGPYSKEDVEDTLTKNNKHGSFSYLKVVSIKDLIEESEKT